jgi:hypothetical protein
VGADKPDGSRCRIKSMEKVIAVDEYVKSGNVYMFISFRTIWSGFLVRPLELVIKILQRTGYPKDAAKRRVILGYHNIS